MTTKQEKATSGEVTLEKTSTEIVAQENLPVKQEMDFVTPEILQRMVEYETASRRILTEYIANHLKDGTDYGPIHFVKKSVCDKGAQCTNKYHFSKPSLFKSGSEKFTSLFKLRPLFTKDEDTWEMAGHPNGLFCYVCRLTNSRGDVMAEGRGSCSIAEKDSPNNAIKIAQKRAQTDAVLRHGALSDFFTQDLEDMKFDDTDNSQTTTSNTSKKTTSRPASEAQLNLIKKLIAQKKVTHEMLTEAKLPIDEPMAIDEAKKVIEWLINYLPTYGEVSEEAEPFIKGLKLCQTVDEYNLVKYDIEEARINNKLSDAGYKRVVKEAIATADRLKKKA